MSKQACQTCQSLKTTLECGLCQGALCKSCANFLAEETFSFFPKIPVELQHLVYCHSCFDSAVAPALQAYNQWMEQAKNIQVFDKSQGKETRLIKRADKSYRVEGVAGYEESILRLAFFAAQDGYNSVLDVHAVPKKLRNGSYQTTTWSATGTPAHVQPEKLVKDRSIWQNPN